MGAVVTPFKFDESGSRVLREWNKQRQLEKALTARAQKQMSGGGFAGAAVTRLTSSLAQWSGAVNYDLDGALVILRARARSLCANYEFGRRFLSLVATNIIGPSGPTLQVRAKQASGNGLDKAANDAIETHWALWGKKADITGRMSLTRLLQVTAKSVARDGEALVRVIRNRKLPYGIALQLLEADRLDESINVRLENGHSVRQGVEIDAMSKPVAYYVMTTHPGDNYASGGKKVERVDARDLFHIYLPERAEQVRGYTWMHAVLQRANNTSGYEEAAIVAARVGASKMGIFTLDPDKAPGGDFSGLADSKDTSGNLQMTAEPGEFFQLPAGYDLKSWDPEYPHANFESFMAQCMRGLSMGLDVATHNLSGNMREVNYSSARIAELAEREIWMTLQEWLWGCFMQPLYEDWLMSALLTDSITFPSGSALPARQFAKFASVSRFQGRRWMWVDPKNDVQTAREQIAEGLNSRTRIAAAQGMEFEDVVDELAQEEVLLNAANIPRPQLKPAPSEPMQADAEI